MESLLSSRTLFRRFWFIGIAYATIAGLVGGGSIFLGMGLPPQQNLYLFSILAPLAIFGLFIVDTFCLWLIYRPIKAGLQSIERGESDPKLIQRAYIQLMNFPNFTFLRIVFAHLPAGILLALVGSILANETFSLGLNIWQIFTASVITSTIGLSHAILEYFAVTRVIRQVVPRLKSYFGELLPEESTRIWHVNTRLRLLFITLQMFITPMIILSVTTAIRLNSIVAELGIQDVPQLGWLTSWFISFTLMVTIVTILMAFLLSDDLKSLIQPLVNALHTVEQGDLQTNLAITTTDEFAALYRGFNSMTSGLREREQLHDAFGRYVSPELATAVLSGEMMMAGKTVTATVMFLDIRGYTAMSEKLTPPEIVTMLNSFYALVEPAIQEHGGWINKFLGDGFMVTFGAPVALDNHRLRAVKSAMAIRDCLVGFNKASRAKNLPEISVGMGIASGEMLAGSIGSPNRIEYTVIGDAVNTAARIESLNKEMKSDILVSDDVYKDIADHYTVESKPPTLVKGKSDAIQVYAVLAEI